MKGWVSLHRNIQEHWIWGDPKYLKWWITILMNVNHEEKTFLVGLETFTCNPGQSFRSIDQWTSQFSCSKKTTIKFFKMLQKEEMIECKNVGKGNRRKHLLTVVNWGKYQSAETENCAERVLKTTLEEYSNVPSNNNDNNDNNENKKKGLQKNVDLDKVLLSKIDYSPEFEEVFLKWLRYKRKSKQSYKDEDSAQIAYNKLIKYADNNPEAALAIVEQSMGNNWSGLYGLKTNQKSSTNGHFRQKGIPRRHGEVSCQPGDNQGSSTL
jgi:hypothetical protein